MPRGKTTSPSMAGNKTGPKAMTPEARESQLISLAVDLAEQQLRDGLVTLLDYGQLLYER